MTRTEAAAHIAGPSAEEKFLRMTEDPAARPRLLACLRQEGLLESFLEAERRGNGGGVLTPAAPPERGGLMEIAAAGSCPAHVTALFSMLAPAQRVMVERFIRLLSTDAAFDAHYHALSAGSGGLPPKELESLMDCWERGRRFD